MHSVWMRRYTKPACKRCGELAADVGPLSWQGYCFSCGMARFLEANYSHVLLLTDDTALEAAVIESYGFRPD